MITECVVTPTRSGNGFIAGNRYLARHHLNGLYVITVNGHDKYIFLEEPSPHLWTGLDWADAGSFELVL